MTLVLGPIVDHATPVYEDALARDIATLLRAVKSERGRVAGLASLLGPGVRPSSIRAALRLADSADQPYARLRPNNIDLYDPADAVLREIARVQARRELYFRALYIANTAKRVEASRLDRGETIGSAIQREKPHYLAHGRARIRRLDAAAQAARTQANYGPLLGWYADPESNSERECLVADGCNFYADQPPVIGYPSAVHPHCRCLPGPPHPGGQLVDVALAGVLHLIPRKATTIGRTQSRQARRAS